MEPERRPIRDTDGIEESGASEVGAEETSTSEVSASNVGASKAGTWKGGSAGRDGRFRGGGLRETAGKMGEAVLDLLFPRKCPFCGRLSKGICPQCNAALPWTTETDGLRDIGFPESAASDGNRVPGFSLPCAAALRYDGLAREGLLRMKFRGRPAAAEDLGALIAQCAAERFGGGFDTVTWVPVSAKRRRKRGYDQAELLSRAACRLWDTAPVRLLDKVRDNPAQSGLSDAAQRQANVSGVYRVRDGAAGRRVLLIDDICTTGATLRECAAALYAGGAASVVCAAAAFAGRT